jgi:hypothetical protein
MQKNSGYLQEEYKWEEIMETLATIAIVLIIAMLIAMIYEA